MKRLPGNKYSENDAYELNEKGQEGFYPVGINNCWHSGIHFDLPSGSGQYPLHPILNGELVAYRFTNDLCEIESTKEISKSDYNDLDQNQKKQYELYPKEEDPVKNAIEIYKLKKDEDSSIYKFSNNFALLKHCLSIPGKNSKGEVNIKEFNFFTLYTNLKPINCYKFISKYSDYETLSSKLYEKTPISLDWKFKVSVKNQYKEYQYGPRGKIFPLCHFEIRNEDCFYAQKEFEKFRVEFKNSKNNLVEIPVDDIEIFEDEKIIIKPNRENVPFYRMNPNYLNSDYKLEVATLKNSDKISFNVVKSNYMENRWAENNNYITIELNKNKIIESKIKGWIDPDKHYLHKPKENSYYLRDNDNSPRVLYNIEELNLLDSNTNAYKLVTFKEYLKKTIGTTKYIEDKDLIKRDGSIITYISSDLKTDRDKYMTKAKNPINFDLAGTDEFVLVFNRDKNLRDKKSATIYDKSYSFYYNDKKLIPLKVDPTTFRNIISVEKDLEADISTITQILGRGKLTGLVIDKIMDLFEDDWLKKIKHNNRGITKLGKKENLLYTNFYIRRDIKTKWVVKAEDMELKEGKRGRVKANTPNTYNSSKKGIMLYNTPGLDASGNPEGNPEKILETDSEFTLLYPEGFIHAKTTQFHALNKTIINGNEENSRGYFIDISNRNDVLVKSTVKDGYKINDKVELTNKQVTSSRVLGYGNIDKKGTQTQEVALFFKDSKFLNNKEKLELNRYKIKPDTPLYTYEPNECKKVFFSPYSELSIIKTSDLKDIKSYKCKLKRAVIHFRGRDICELLTEEERKKAGIPLSDKNRYFKVINTPEKLWIFNYELIEDVSKVNSVIKPLAKSFNKIWAGLKGKVFKFVANGGGDTKALYVDLPKLLNDKTYWFNSEDIADHSTIKDNLIIIDAFTKAQSTDRCKGVPYYNKNPLYKEFSKVNRVGIFEGNLTSEAGINRIEYANNSGKDSEYIGITIKEREFFLDKKAAKDCKDNLLDFKNYFKISDEDNNDDIFCDLNKELINRIDTTPEGEETGDGIISDKELMLLFKNRKNPGYKDVVESLRKHICKHPLEWNKNLFKNIEDKFKEKNLDNSKAYIENLKSMVEKLDIWEGIKSIDGIDNQLNLWFSHPISMVKHLDNMKILENNPYLNKNISVNRNGFIKKLRNQLNIKDNPGFAPLWYGNHSRYPVYSEKRLLGVITSLFNVPRGKTYYEHQGIDIATGRMNTPVISFIHGTVWACTWDKSTRRNDNKGYGKVMIIKNKIEGKLYLLAHLHSFLKDVGDEVVPGDEVALTGSTGWSTGEHLHLEVRLCKETIKNNVLNKDKNKYPGTGTKKDGLAWHDKLNVSKPFGPHLVNPFDHSEKYREWKC